MNEGYTLVLPGVLGHAPWDNNLAAGLEDAGVPGAIEVYDWTQGPLMLGYNLFAGNNVRQHGEKVARKIVDYQRRYPGRPVHLIGHSGGATAVINTLESLPENSRVTSAVLLAPGLPADYDLRPALSHTTGGIHNYYSPYDLLISAVYLPTMANHRFQCEPVAAGAFGFHVPDEVQGWQRTDYERALKQHPYQFEMVEGGNLGDHFGWTNPAFVARWIAPVIKQPVLDIRRLPQPNSVAAPSSPDPARSLRRSFAPPPPPALVARSIGR
jgi:pimeloyl-ACP methyl ester carboxylesterase